MWRHMKVGRCRSWAGAAPAGLPPAAASSDAVPAAARNGTASCCCRGVAVCVCPAGTAAMPNRIVSRNARHIVADAMASRLGPKSSFPLHVPDIPGGRAFRDRLSRYASNVVHASLLHNLNERLALAMPIRSHFVDPRGLRGFRKSLGAERRSPRLLPATAGKRRAGAGLAETGRRRLPIRCTRRSQSFRTGCPEKGPEPLIRMKRSG